MARTTKCFGLMSIVDNLPDFATLLEQIFTVALSKKVNKDCNDDVANLMGKVETFDFGTSEYSIENKEVPDENDSRSEVYENSEILDYVNDLKEKSYERSKKKSVWIFTK